MTTELRRLETPDNLEKFVEPDFYVEWQQREGVKVINDFAFEDLATVEVGPWERKGGSGAIINYLIMQYDKSDFAPVLGNGVHLLAIIYLFQLHSCDLRRGCKFTPTRGG